MQKWRLQYASHSLYSKKMVDLFEIVQNDAEVENAPPGWFAQLVRSVSRLAVKPVNLVMQLFGVDIQVDTKQLLDVSFAMVLQSRELALEQARAEKARIAAERNLEIAQGRVMKTKQFFEDYIVNTLNDHLDVEISAMLVGGQGKIKLICIYKTIY